MKIHLSNPFSTVPATRPVTETNASFQKWNRNLTIVFALQAIAILLLSTKHLIPVTTSFLTKDTLASNTVGHTVFAPATHVLHNFNLAHLVALVLLITAVVHLVAALWYRSRYEYDLKSGVNRLRWYEYAFSSGLTLVVLALVAGVYDAGSLFMIFALTAVASLCGLILQTYHPATKKAVPNWLSYVVGGLAAVAPWLVITGTLVSASVFGSGRLAGYVYWLFGTMLLLFTSFAINLCLQYKKQGMWTDYYYGERVYMVLSLAAKSLVAWILYFGVLHP